MDFMLDKAKDYSQALQFSDEEEIKNDADDFINNEEISEEGVSFYRERDTLDLNNYYKFNNQTRDPRKAIFEDCGIFFGEDSQPELFVPEDRESVDFDKVQSFEKHAQSFKDTLLKFDNVENYLLHSVVYGLMFEVDNRETKFDLKNAQKILGDDLYFDLMETESETILGKNTFGYFDKDHKINQVISKHGICFKFFERRNMY